jgi:hypothetical protein
MYTEYVFCIAKKSPIEEYLCLIDKCPEWKNNGGRCNIPYYIIGEKPEPFLKQEKIDKYVVVRVPVPENILNELKSKTHEDLTKNTLIKVVYHYLNCPRAHH